MAAISQSEPFIIYCNGIDNSFQSAISHAAELVKLTKQPCTLFYNNATTPEKINSLVGTGVVSAVGLLGVIACGAGGFVVAGAAGLMGINLLDKIDTIQTDKQGIAQQLAQYMVNQLYHNPNRHIIVIGHSQGAHVVSSALGVIQSTTGIDYAKRTDLLHRISAITIGGLTPVCAGQAARIANIINEGDGVATGLAPAYKDLVLKNLAHSSLPPCDFKCQNITASTSHLGHGAINYLQNKKFLDALFSYIRISPMEEAKARELARLRQAQVAMIPTRGFSFVSTHPVRM